MWINNGTVAVTNASPTVTGTSTSFVARHVVAGDLFAGPDGRSYQILSVISETVITLARPYQGATASGQAYDIVQQTVGAHDNIVTKIQTLLDNWSSSVTLSGTLFGGGAAEPGANFAYKGALHSLQNTGSIIVKLVKGTLADTGYLDFFTATTRKGRIGLNDADELLIDAEKPVRVTQSVIIANVADPVSPENGTLWKDASTGIAKLRQGGTTRNILGREVLSAARTYYVRTDGNDANTGLANNAGGAFLAIQRAIDVVISTIDTAGFDVTVQMGSGTYGPIFITSSPVGGGKLLLIGDTTTPGNVVVSGGSTVPIDVSNADVTYSGLHLTATSAAALVRAGNGARVFAQTKNQYSGTPSDRVVVNSNAYFESGGQELISGTVAGTHYAVALGGALQCSGVTWVATGTVAQAIFAFNIGGRIQAGSNTVTGTFTGSRYLVTLNGVINTGTGNVNYLPGSTAGSLATGGQYA